MADRPEILFGPYGTELAKMSRELGEPELSDPVAVLNGRHCGEAVEKVAAEYLRQGARVGTVNGFGLRGLLKEPGELRTYRKALRGQDRALREAVSQVGRGVGQRVSRVLSFGPQNDCYSPEEAPGRAEAADFHEIQAAAAREMSVDVAWFETVNTVEEAAGMALAGQRQRVQTVISFVLNREGKLLSGESVGDAIRAVDSASGKYPLGYSLNCCPIEALEPALRSTFAAEGRAGGQAEGRVIAAYPNASSKDQRELERSEKVIGLGEGEGGGETALRAVAARHMHELAHRFGLKVIGGCCGYCPSDIHYLSRALV